MGCIVGLMQLIMAPSSELYANVFETSAALLMSFLGTFQICYPLKPSNIIICPLSLLPRTIIR